MTLAIETTGLTKRFGAHVAINDVRLEVEEGASYGLLGATGAGKTTTVRLLTGLALPDKGTIRIFGRRVSQGAPGVEGAAGVLPDRLTFFDYLTAREYLELVGRNLLPSRRARQAQAEELLRLVDLEDSADRLVLNSSYGEKKKLALAASLAHRPRLLILDDPLEGVDAASRTRLENLLAGLPSQGITLFLTSSSLRLIDRICTRIGVLDQGRLVTESRTGPAPARQAPLMTVSVRK